MPGLSSDLTNTDIPPEFLNINSYKVKGYSKYSDPGFINHIRNKDIICLLETHCPFQESLILQ
jgi:hypothetical protein